jgi:NADH-quinone oxidoreductase subunit E
MQIDKERQAHIKKIVEAYPADKRYSLTILQAIQHEFSYIPREAMTVVCSHIGTSEAQLYAIATFYKALSLKPKGRHVIKVCDGTACHMRGNFTLIKGIETELGISPGETSSDGMFSLELVNCLGSCALAPIMVIDDIYYSQVTREKLNDAIKEYQQ